VEGNESTQQLLFPGNGSFNEAKPRITLLSDTSIPLIIPNGALSTVLNLSFWEKKSLQSVCNIVLQDINGACIKRHHCVNANDSGFLSSVVG